MRGAHARLCPPGQCADRKICAIYPQTIDTSYNNTTQKGRFLGFSAIGVQMHGNSPLEM